MFLLMKNEVIYLFKFYY